MLNHAFLMMVHKSPELFSRIVHILAKENHYFFVHIDKKSNNYQEFVKAVNDIDNIVFIPRMENYHGSVTQIYCEISLFKYALEFPTKLDYFHLISGQDYPLRTNEVFDKFFEDNNGFSFACIEGKKFHEEKMKHSYLMRTQLYHPNKNNKWQYLILRLTWRLQLKLKIRSEIPNLWGGWNWKSLTRNVTEFMLYYIENNPKFLKRLNHTMCCDEIYFPTIFHNRMEEFNIKGLMPLRYVSFNPTHPVENNYRPYTLDERDFPYIITSQAFFCRKVDLPKSNKLLDLIDTHRNAPFDFTKATPVLELKSYD